MRNGAVDFQLNGIASNESGDWYCRGGQVDFGAAGVLESETEGFSGWYYIQNGCVQKGQETVKQNSNGWWYIGTDGKVDFHKNTVAPNEYGWWAVRNGAVDFQLNGIASNESGDWYCRGGQVDFWRSRCAGIRNRRILRLVLYSEWLCAERAGDSKNKIVMAGGISEQMEKLILDFLELHPTKTVPGILKMERLILLTPVLMKMRMDGFMTLNLAM